MNAASSLFKAPGNNRHLDACGLSIFGAAQLQESIWEAGFQQHPEGQEDVMPCLPLPTMGMVFARRPESYSGK